MQREAQDWTSLESNIVLRNRQASVLMPVLPQEVAQGEASPGNTELIRCEGESTGEGRRSRDNQDRSPWSNGASEKLLLGQWPKGFLCMRMSNIDF